MRIVLTGGPGAGKTAILEMIKLKLHEKRIILIPEAASIVFGGGFWRHNTIYSKIASQRAIYHVQQELEFVVEKENKDFIAICDRGTLDSIAYWPNDSVEFWSDVKSSKTDELKRYDLVIHLRTPTKKLGYNHQNPLRVESPLEAHEIDEKIIKAWDGHHNRVFIESKNDFLEKANEAILVIENFINKGK